MTREGWLLKAIELHREVFKKYGYTLPRKIRVSLGFPRENILGLCYYPENSKDKTYEIFISPTIDEPVEVLSTLTHELVHTLFHPDVKHGKEFKIAAYTVGLTPPATTTKPGPIWFSWANNIIDELGEYPHSAMIKLAKESGIINPMVKCVCSNEECQFLFRTTQKHINRFRDLTCPGCRKKSIIIEK